MKLKLVDKKQEAQGTKSFFFETEKEFDFLPGQYFYLTLPKLNYKDPRGATRHFTISSSPTEGKVIRIATRIREQSGYKRTLDELKINDMIEGDGPEGTFVLDEKEKGPHTMLAGGIGITPFRSMVKYSLDKQSLLLRSKKLNTSIYLIYSNPTPKLITFRKELEKWSKSSAYFSLNMTITRPENSKEKWKGLTERIDEQILKSQITNLKSQTFWLCGSPVFVDAMEKILGNLNIGSGSVRSEKFSGY